MARTNRKSVYERIEDKKQNIKEAEEMLAQLKNELQELLGEKDELEMKLLLEAMKAKGLNINEALSKFEVDVDEVKETKSKSKRSSKEVLEDKSE